MRQMLRHTRVPASLGPALVLLLLAVLAVLRCSWAQSGLDVLCDARRMANHFIDGELQKALDVSIECEDKHLRERSQHKGALGAPEGGVTPSAGAQLRARLDDAFVVRLGGSSQTLPPLGVADRSWGSRYLLVHSLAHILVNQLVFECGYSTAFLRERLYVSADTKASMAGILLYTAAGDSEGTLGGLVRLGRPSRPGPIVRRALSRASSCSADPVCSENLGGQGPRGQT